MSIELNSQSAFTQVIDLGLEGYSLERVMAESVQYSQIAGEYVADMHTDVSSIRTMTPQEGDKVIAGRLDGLVDRVTDAHHLVKIAREEKDTHEDTAIRKDTDSFTILELANRHLSVEQTLVADFIHRWRDQVIDK
jgi:hypothetical protein